MINLLDYCKLICNQCYTEHLNVFLTRVYFLLLPNKLIKSFTNFEWNPPTKSITTLICIIVSREYNLFSPYCRSAYLFCFVSVLSSILPISQMVPSIANAIYFSLSRTMMSSLFATSRGHVPSKCWTCQKIFALEFYTFVNGCGCQYHGSRFC